LVRESYTNALERTIIDGGDVAVGASAALPRAFPDSVLRALQRRVNHWCAEHGNKREISFALEHQPGRLGLS